MDLFLMTIDDEGIMAFLNRNPEEKKDVERALGYAAKALRGREYDKVGIVRNTSRLMMAIALEAIQENCSLLYA